MGESQARQVVPFSPILPVDLSRHLLSLEYSIDTHNNKGGDLPRRRLQGIIDAALSLLTISFPSRSVLPRSQIRNTPSGSSIFLERGHCYELPACICSITAGKWDSALFLSRERRTYHSILDGMSRTTRVVHDLRKGAPLPPRTCRFTRISLRSQDP